MPSGGWRYEQPIVGQNPLTVTAATYDELSRKVFQFRLAHTELITHGSATTDSVEVDLHQWICENQPANCAGGIEIKVASSSRYASPLARLEDWHRTIANTDIEFTDAAEAVSRAEICAQCPQNIGWRSKGCLPCNKAMDQKVLRIKGSRSTPKDSELGMCRCFGWSLTLAVWLQHAFPKAKQPQPEHCWIK